MAVIPFIQFPTWSGDLGSDRVEGGFALFLGLSRKF